MNEESLDRRLQSLLKQGRKIEAIKLCKDELKIEFDDARQYIDEMIHQIESDSEPVSNDTQAVPINIQTTNFEPLEKSIEDSDKDTPNEKSEIFNTQPSKSTPDSEKTKKNDDKISLKTKIIAGIVFLVILKGCSYHHYSTGGDNSGSKLSKLLFWIADTVIPWPKTPRPESEASNEVDGNETDDIESNTYSQSETADVTDDLKSKSEFTGNYEYKTEAFDDAAMYDIDLAMSVIMQQPSLKDSVIYHIPSGHKVYVIEDNEDYNYARVYCDGYEGYVKKSLLKNYYIIED